MLVIPGIRNGEPDLMKARSPSKVLRRGIQVQRPRLAQIAKKLQRGALHARCLGQIDVVLIDETANRSISYVLMTHSPDDFVQQPFAQRPR